MNADGKLLTIAAILALLLAYTGAYAASVTRLQVNYGNPSGLLISAYDNSWQRALFQPIEDLDRWLFPARWHWSHVPAKQAH